MFFSCSPFGLYDHSFDPSVVDAQPVLVMGAFSFGIAVFFEIYLSWGSMLLPCHFHLHPRRVFNFNRSIQILKLQFFIIDQILDLTSEPSAIFCRVTWIPAMVVASSIGIVPSWKWRLERCQLNWLDVTTLYQLWEQFSVSDGDGIPSGLVLVDFWSVRFAS